MGTAKKVFDTSYLNYLWVFDTSYLNYSWVFDTAYLSYFVVFDTTYLSYFVVFEASYLNCLVGFDTSFLSYTQRIDDQVESGGLPLEYRVVYFLFVLVASKIAQELTQLFWYRLI